ncbi:MAG: molybdenum cofactor biosynthesis protein MoaE [Anaerolineales bacterium]|jgi:molybdopterin synthase catalytic subunit|nr:molybdenum cofactor biosynthesis protein MoaE [Anaerolineales bacterium]
MNVTVLFFATLKEHAGTERMVLELTDHATVTDLKDALAEHMPTLEKLLSIALVSVNREFAFPEDLLPPDAEVGIFPPVSGGQEPPTIVLVRAGPLSVDELTAGIIGATTGAICVFSGIVRARTTLNDAHQQLRDTEQLQYEAYVPMAEAKIQQVVEEIRARWPEVAGIAIVQRIGVLAPGTPTVLIACAGAHRDSGVFPAARYGIDRLKEIVPVWKKEIGPAGTAWLQGQYQPTPKDQAAPKSALAEKTQ